MEETRILPVEQTLITEYYRCHLHFLSFLNQVSLVSSLQICMWSVFVLSLA